MGARAPARRAPAGGGRIAATGRAGSYPVNTGLTGRFGGLGFGFGSGEPGTLGPSVGPDGGGALTVAVSVGSPQAVGPVGVFRASPE